MRFTYNAEGAAALFLRSRFPDAGPGDMDALAQLLQLVWDEACEATREQIWQEFKDNIDLTAKSLEDKRDEKGGQP